MNKIKTLILLLFVSTSLIAQEIEIPIDVKLEETEDYKNTEQLFIDATEWIVNTPLSENPAKRKEVNAF